MSKIIIDRLEFYITNVCNLTCNGCNRYNNYHFRGWQKWDDYADIVAQWSKKIEVLNPVILGGEPLLNPSINQWITGLRKAWPNNLGVQIQSNGTRINRVPGLYKVIGPEHGAWIGVSLHSNDDREELFDRIRKFLKAPIRETVNPNNGSGAVYHFYDANHREVNVWINNMFVQNNIIEQPNGKFGLYNSDPDLAHKNCAFRANKNYHWIRGKIYKCGPVALMPEFDQQHHFDIDEQDRHLLNSYQALTIENVDQHGKEFFKKIDNVIPQCKFCPEVYVYQPITFANTKKSWKISTE